MTSRERLLWAAFERIKARPEEFDQETWGFEWEPRSQCGTVGCLAFHVCVVANGKAPTTLVSESAAALLDIPHTGLLADGLFACDGFAKAPDKVEWLRQHITAWLEKHGSDGKEVRAL